MATKGHALMLEKTKNPYLNLLAEIAPYWPAWAQERLKYFVGFEPRYDYAIKKGGRRVST